MPDLIVAAQKAARKFTESRSFIGDVEIAFDQITEARLAGATLKEIASQAGVNPKRLSEAYTLVRKRRLGLVKPKDGIFRSPAAKAVFGPAKSETIPALPDQVPQQSAVIPNPPVESLSLPTVKKPLILGAALEKFARHGQERVLDKGLADQAKSELNTLLGSKVRS